MYLLLIASENLILTYSISFVRDLILIKQLYCYNYFLNNLKYHNIFLQIGKVLIEY